MSELLEIQELARLFLKSQQPYGKGNFGDIAAFQKAFDYYRDHHEHLVETFHDKELREKYLATTVRAIANKILLHEETASETESPIVAKTVKVR